MRGQSPGPLADSTGPGGGQSDGTVHTRTALAGGIDPVPAKSELATEPRTLVDSPPAQDVSIGTVLYLRVSTEDQDLAGQERELGQEAARRGWAVAAIYAEKVSGTGKVERKEYERLLADARKAGRPWTHLLVWSLDRFSREATFTKATQTILDLEAAGVRFHSLKEPTLDTPQDGNPNLGRDVLLALLPVISAFESKRRSERVRVAMAELKAGRRQTRSGRPPGRPIRVTPEKRAAILRWKAEGLSWRALAQKVGLPRGTCANVASKTRRAGLRL
jgi:DNA invertase Pin-like site-specific DNA recombinase